MDGNLDDHEVRKLKGKWQKVLSIVSLSVLGRAVLEKSTEASGVHGTMLPPSP